MKYSVAEDLTSKMFFFFLALDGVQEPGLKHAQGHQLEGLPLASSAEPVSAIFKPLSI